MSNNRLLYDVEAFTEHTKGNKDQESYQKDINRFQNKNRCGSELDTVKRIELESKMFGLERLATKCSAWNNNPDKMEYKPVPKDKKYEWSPPDACNITAGHIQSCNHNQKLPKADTKSSPESDASASAPSSE